MSSSLVDYFDSGLDLVCFPYLIFIPEKVGPQLDTGTICRASVRKVDALLGPQSNDPWNEDQYPDRDGSCITG